MVKYDLKNEAAYFDEGDIKLTISRGIKPLITFDKTRGGSRVYKAGSSSVCTSSWSVIVPGLGTGVMTAGHCMINGKDRIIKHSSGGGTSTTYPMIEYYNAYYDGYAHDVGVYDTPTTGEEYKFWAHASEVRYVWG